MLYSKYTIYLFILSLLVLPGSDCYTLVKVDLQRSVNRSYWLSIFHGCRINFVDCASGFLDAKDRGSFCQSITKDPPVFVIIDFWEGIYVYWFCSTFSRTGGWLAEGYKRSSAGKLPPKSEVCSKGAHKWEQEVLMASPLPGNFYSRSPRFDTMYEGARNKIYRLKLQVSVDWLRPPFLPNASLLCFPRLLVPSLMILYLPPLPLRFT